MKSPLPPNLPQDLLPALGLARFVALDTETTGLNPTTDRIIEVGAVRFCAGAETERFSSLINCPLPLPAPISRLTGIRENMLEHAPEESSVLQDLLAFIGKDPLVAQNAPFDLAFLHNRIKQNRITVNLRERKCADSALLARVLLPTLPSRSLSALGDYFNLPADTSHRALPDARRCGQVFLHLLAYFNRVDIKSVDLLRHLADGLNHPSAWIFAAWADYLLRTSSLEGRFRAYRLPGLRDNVLGKLPAGQSVAYPGSAEDTEYEKVKVAEVSAFFQPTSRLAETIPNFEFRPQQAQMAEAVAQAFNEGGFLAVEAGTGVGKSLAYLLPAICWARANRQRGERVIVSTNTRNLQEQLFYKDLPTLADSLSPTFVAVLLKGRSNYLCRRRWRNLTSDRSLRLSSNERLALLPLVLWTQQTRTGDIGEVGAFGAESTAAAIWHRLASDQGSCRGKRCRERQRCYHNRIRSAAARAQIVVINHALLLSDLAANRVPIGSYCALIVDEAHHLERSASQHLGRELSSWMLRSWTSRMYESEGVETGLLAQIALGLGAAPADHPLLDGLKSSVETAARDVAVLRKTALDFFRQLTLKLRARVPAAQNSYSQKLRLRQPPKFLSESNDTLENAAAPAERLSRAIKAASTSLREILQILGDLPRGILPRKDDWAEELKGAREEIEQIEETFDFFRTAPHPDWVYWAELPGKIEYDALLYAAPLHSGGILREQLFAPLRTAILTSATLTVAGRFHYFLRKVGLKEQENLKTLCLGSPFEFEKQMLIGLPAYLPSPRQPEFELNVIQLIQKLLQHLPQGTLGLFTSHRMLAAAARTLNRELQDRHLLIQGQNGSRDQLLRQFRSDPGSVLLGTDSFWEGIDVVGAALELLLVAKLPFEVPSEPLVEARLEKLKAEGKDPFMYYTVPEAITRLRQGLGRLIRSKSDRGAALICDSRLMRSHYGEAFLQSLPVAVKVFSSEEETIAELQKFFSKSQLKIAEDR